MDFPLYFKNVIWPRQGTVQCPVQCKLQCSVKYRHVGCPGTYWFVTKQHVKNKLAPHSHVQQIYHNHSILNVCTVQPDLVFLAKIGGNFHSRVLEIGGMVHGYALKSPRGRHSQFLESPIYLYTLLTTSPYSTHSTSTALSDPASTALYLPYWQQRPGKTVEKFVRVMKVSCQLVMAQENLLP